MSRAAARDLLPRGRDDAGFSIAILLAGITIMFIAMGAAVPTWRYVMKNDREEELYFRGDQIARAIERYQRKNANTLPVSLELLVKGRYLRKVYKEPMSKDGKWRIIHPGEALIPGVPGAGAPGAGGGAGLTGASPPLGGRRPSPSPGIAPGVPGMPGAAGATQGAILGVASTSMEKSLRVFNGRTRYDQWLFVANQPRLLGGDQAPAQLPGGMPGMPGGMPGVRPGATPLPPGGVKP